MAKGWLVIWLAPGPEREERFHQLTQKLMWTMDQRGEPVHLAPATVAWRLRVPVEQGTLVEIASALNQESRVIWALAVVAEPSQGIGDLLPRLRGQIVIDERVAEAECGRHWDHPLGPELRELGLALWNVERRDQEPPDPTEALSQMRSVPHSSNARLKSQRISIHLPRGTSPGQYAGIAYSDVPDGSVKYNGIGGRHVLLFHSAMECGYPPYERHTADRRYRPLRGHEHSAEPGVFVFLNAAAVGVRHFSVNEVPNGLVAHVLAGRICVESAIGEPDEKEREDHV